jgi:hypothetical protein
MQVLTGQTARSFRGRVPDLALRRAESLPEGGVVVFVEQGDDVERNMPQAGRYGLLTHLDSHDQQPFASVRSVVEDGQRLFLAQLAYGKRPVTVVAPDLPWLDRRLRLVLDVEAEETLSAICWADYQQRVAARKQAEQEQEEAKRLRKPCSNELPAVSYFDFFDVRFFGRQCDVIVQVARTEFAVELGNKFHVFVGVDPKGIIDGVHPVLAYGSECLLRKWTAQGFPRGLVTLADDAAANAVAEVYRESGTWSWVLSGKDKEKLEALQPPPGV